MYEYRVYLDDILDSTEKIERYTKDLSYKEVTENSMIVDAVIRNLEIIGEAVKRLPADVKGKHPTVEWKKIAGLRDILIHEYSGINLDIIWDVIVNKIPDLRVSIKKIIKEM